MAPGWGVPGARKAASREWEGWVELIVAVELSLGREDNPKAILWILIYLGVPVAG
jgi:hypothetical protein